MPSGRPLGYNSRHLPADSILREYANRIALLFEALPDLQRLEYEAMLRMLLRDDDWEPQAPTWDWDKIAEVLKE